MSRAVAELQGQCAELRQEVATQDQRIADLKEILQRVHAPVEAVHLPQPSNHPFSAAAVELLQQMRDLAAFHSNTLAALEQLNARMTVREPQPRTEQQWLKSIATLEQSLTEQLQRYQAARDRTADLLLKLSIPDEIAQMDVNRGLNSASLQPYWPYFEAKRECESHQLVCERLRLRIIQEQVDRPISQ